MISRAAATVVPDAHERVHLHTAATDERHRQEHRNSDATPPARHPAAQDRQAPPHPVRSGLPRRPPPPTPKAATTAAAPDRLPRYGPALAPRSAPPSPHQG